MIAAAAGSPGAAARVTRMTAGVLPASWARSSSVPPAPARMPRGPDTAPAACRTASRMRGPAVGVASSTTTPARTAPRTQPRRPVLAPERGQVVDGADAQALGRGGPQREQVELARGRMPQRVP